MCICGDVVNTMYDKHTANDIFHNGQKLKVFPLEVRSKAGMPTLPTLSHDSTVATAIRKKQEIKRHSNWKGIVTI